jgi:cold shock CspA family protein
MPTGTICDYFAPRAFGFVRPDDGGQDVFFHRHAIAGHDEEIQAGRRVSYIVIAQPDERLRATAVHFLNNGQGG